MNAKFLKKFLFVLTTSAVIQSTLQFKALSEVADSEVYEAPKAAAPVEQPRPDPVITTSIRPFPRPVKLNAQQISVLQSRPCPGGEYCPGLPADFNQMCSNFIDSNGSYPSDGHGILMLEAMQEVEAAHRNDPVGSSTAQCSFFENINFGPSCPNFRYMTPIQKQHVWVWLWAAMAQAKSSCNLNVDARGILNEELGRYEVADGLYGLEKHFDTRESNGRDERFCPHESVNDSKNLFFQSRCAASIMYDKSCRGISIVNSDSYWLQFRNLSGKIPGLMQKHPLCNSSLQNSDLNPENQPSS